MSYEARGVSARKEDVHAATAGLDKGLYPDTFCKVLPDFMAHDPAYANLLHADGAGTKSALAYAYWRQTGDLSVWAGIAQDALVMNFDDMACAGAMQDFVVSSSIGRHKRRIPGAVLTAIIQGTQAFLDQMAEWGISAHFAGGETADLGDLVQTIVVDATVMARMPQEKVVRNRLSAGQVVIGLASSGQARYESAYNTGIGSNGLTLARHELLSPETGRHYPETFDETTEPGLVYRGPYRLTDPLPGMPLDAGRALLSPTRTYLPFLKPLLAEYQQHVNGLIHCTGGGQTKVNHFLTPGLKVVKDQMMPIPPLFEAIQKTASLDWREMYQVFNMGHRLELYTDERTAETALDLARSLDLDAKTIGRVEEAETTEAEGVVIHHGDRKLFYPRR